MPLDITVLTPQISVGGGIYHKENVGELVKMKITHIVDMQGEFDDGPLFEGTGIKTLWVPFHDVMSAPSKELLDYCYDFISTALKNPKSRLHCHCAAGVNRGPMATLFTLCVSGMDIESAAKLIKSRRLIANFPKVYYDAIKKYIYG
jgi:protein-tyrosine phosphatase